MKRLLYMVFRNKEYRAIEMIAMIDVSLQLTHPVVNDRLIRERIALLKTLGVPTYCHHHLHRKLYWKRVLGYQTDCRWANRLLKPKDRVQPFDEFCIPRLIRYSQVKFY